MADGGEGDVIVGGDGALAGAAPTTPMEVWRELLAGRMSFHARFDREGECFFVARRNQEADVPRRALTPREAHVVAYAALGHPNKWIADALGISVGAVSGYLASAVRKMGLESRADLVAFGSRVVVGVLAPTSARDARERRR